MKKQRQRSVQFNYDRIREEVSHNLQQQMPAKPVRRISWRSIAIFAACTVALCVITAGCTYKVTQETVASSQKIVTVYYPVDIGKYETPTIMPVKTAEVMQSFDRYVACCDGYGRLTPKQVCDSRFIGDAAKLALDHYVQHSRDVLARDGRCVVFVGESGGKDVVKIYTEMCLALADCPQCQSVYEFESALDYTFADVIAAFENKHGIVLTQEMLCELQQQQPNRSGLQLTFGFDNQQNTPYESYSIRVDGKLYTIRCGEIEVKK